jgi:hypothetical protein
MEKQIVEQIEKYIAATRKDENQKELHKNGFVKGYNAALDAIESIIEMGKALASQAKKGA